MRRDCAARPGVASRSPDTAERLRAERPNHVWALDFQFDETTDGRRLKLLNIVDEFTRQALAMRVGRRCDADTVVTVVEQLVTSRGAPVHLRMDNGPEMIAWALKDWCRLAGTATAYIEPGSPWENPFVESFNGRVRDELLNVEEFGTVVEAQVLVEARRMEYNSYRPHRPSPVSPPTRSTPDGPPQPNQHSRRSWTSYRGPLRTLLPRALAVQSVRHPYIGLRASEPPRRRVGTGT